MITKEEWESLKEFSEAKRENSAYDKAIEDEKASFARMLKGELSDEIRETLAQKEEIEKKNAKKGWFKNFIEKIARTCHQETY